MKQALPKPWVFPGAYALLAVILLAGGYLAGFWHAPDRVVRTEDVVEYRMAQSAQDLRAAMTVAPQPIPCDSLNIPAELKCEAYESPEYTAILVTP